MKAIKTINKRPKFRPITISLIIESKQEFDLLTLMSELDLTLPKAFENTVDNEYPYKSSDAYKFMQNFLGAINTALIKE